MAGLGNLGSKLGTVLSDLTKSPKLTSAAGKVGKAAAIGGVAVAGNSLLTQPSTPKVPDITTAKTTTPPTPAASPPGRTVSADQANQIMTSLIGGTGTPNPLNAFYNPNYHFRLFMTGDADLFSATGSPGTVAEFYSGIDKLQSIVIAETGVTTYNINNVTIEAIVAPNFETQMTNATSFTIEISEPMGTGFVEALKETAEKLTVNNFNKCFYLLELSFKAYNTDGGFVSNPVSSLSLEGGNRWIWQLTFTNIDTAFDGRGSTYTITAKPFSEYAWDDTYLRVPEMVTMTGDTMGEMFDDLQIRLNDSIQDRFGYKFIQFGNPRTGQPGFVFHPTANATGGSAPSSISGNPANFKMKPLDPEKNKGSGLDMMSAQGKTQGRIQPGTSIPSMIQNALLNTVEAQNLALDRDNKTGATNGSPSAPNSKNIRETIAFRIEADVAINNYDPISQRYTLYVVYHVHPYYTQMPITSDAQINDAQQPVFNRAMIQKMVDGGFLCKHYDYLYTGLNTEVINFNIAYNMAWSALLPRLEGARSGHDVTAVPARLNDNNKAGFDDGKQQVTFPYSALDLKDSEATTADYNQLTDNTNLLTYLKQYSPSDSRIPDLTKAVQARLGSANPQALAVARRTNTLASTAIHDAATAQNTQAQAARSAANPVATGTLAEEVISASPTPLKISLGQNFNQSVDRGGTGFIGQYTRDKTVFGAVLDQLYEPIAQQFMSVDLEIRGDPYWLGDTSLSRQIRLRSANLGENGVVPDQIDYYRGHYGFLLRFRYPINEGDDGSPQFNDSTVFNGVYATSSVTSEFKEGVFKQTLHGKRYPLINLLSAFRYTSLDLNSNDTSKVIASPGSIAAVAANNAQDYTNPGITSS